MLKRKKGKEADGKEEVEPTERGERE